MALLRHDDVLDVFHGEVVAERVVKQPLQLVHGQFLHVALREGGRTDGKEKIWLADETKENNLKKAFCLDALQVRN